ncbi:Myc-type, basic helix-loop-helix domain-containing protein [Cantharellus anzutake]|uniref:Myc-type, basic helix-loop-helix domain-containing protein n=1 Tax=Cantharellus anzutake TaxID=1750568 RepID=UPI0019079FEC|nr:Myc-type, basic helix-loop-helix domain-containing protein [Cantharellus anzutake]KAF8324262.1 Myc-type, basic helix-loop-helix domain-containing protein [Cantharellus anzutake]
MPHSFLRAALLNEKRRRRRESHNAVERRRRDNINEKISELSTLIPDCLLVEQQQGPSAGGNGNPGVSTFSAEISTNEMSPENLIAGGPGGTNGDEEANAIHNGMKANKGVILRKSVDYIR